MLRLKNNSKRQALSLDWNISNLSFIFLVIIFLSLFYLRRLCRTYPLAWRVCQASTCKYSTSFYSNATFSNLHTENKISLQNHRSIWYFWRVRISWLFRAIYSHFWHLNFVFTLFLLDLKVLIFNLKSEYMLSLHLLLCPKFESLRFFSVWRNDWKHHIL